MHHSPKDLNTAFEQICQELLITFLAKHRDYGKGNILSIKELGIIFRETEKVERLRNLLINDKSPSNETIEDNWIDIAVYAVIALLFRRGWFQSLEVSPPVKSSVPSKLSSSK